MRTVTNTVEELETQYQMLLMMIAEGMIGQNESNYLLTALGSELAAAKKAE